MKASGVTVKFFERFDNFTSGQVLALLAPNRRCLLVYPGALGQCLLVAPRTSVISALAVGRKVIS